MEHLLSWQWSSDLVVVLSALWLSYVICWVQVRRSGNQAASVGRLICWNSGLLAVPIAVLSAIDALADVSLTIHMVQHILLIYVAPTLLLLGRPLSIWRAAFTGKPAVPATQLFPLKKSLVSGLNFLLKPPVAWGLSAATLLVWHIPWFYDVL